MLSLSLNYFMLRNGTNIRDGYDGFILIFKMKDLSSHLSLNLISHFRKQFKNNELY